MEDSLQITLIDNTLTDGSSTFDIVLADTSTGYSHPIVIQCIDRDGAETIIDAIQTHAFAKRNPDINRIA